MDPLTLIGAAASVAQLLDMCTRIASSSRSLVQSIMHAPGEIQKLAVKLDRLKLLIEQLEGLGKETSVTQISDIFPVVHQDMLHSCLKLSANALEKLRSLQNAHGTNPTDVKGRLRWATVDKRKAQAILSQIKEAQEALDLALGILGV